jgi:hypothetical protein
MQTTKQNKAVVLIIAIVMLVAFLEFLEREKWRHWLLFGLTTLSRAYEEKKSAFWEAATGYSCPLIIPRLEKYLITSFFGYQSFGLFYRADDYIRRKLETKC